MSIRFSPRLTLLALVGFLWAAASIRAEEPPSGRLIRLEPWTTAFAESDVKVRCRAAVPERVVGRLVWGVESREGITLVRGEQDVDLAAGNADLAFSLRLPSVKPGFVLPSAFTIHLVASGRDVPLATSKLPLWVYPPQPFDGRTKWLTDLKLGLIDPVGATAERLEKEKVPFERLRDASSLEGWKGGIVLVGEGASLREERGLPAALIAAAARGARVICFAPSDGDLQLPTRRPEAGGQESPAGLLLQNQLAIRRLDKRLDPWQWMSVRSASEKTIALARDGAHVIGEVTPGSEGWSWVEATFPPTAPEALPGTLIVCTFPVFRHWEAGPTPPNLFLRMLEYTADGQSAFDPPLERNSP